MKAALFEAYRGPLSVQTVSDFASPVDGVGLPGHEFSAVKIACAGVGVTVIGALSG